MTISTPGVQVNVSERAGVRGAASISGTIFALVDLPGGPTTVQTLTSVKDFYSAFAAAGNPAAPLFDTEVEAGVRTAFAEGAPLMYMLRATGSTPVVADAILPNAATGHADAMTLCAKDAGEYGNKLAWQVDNGTDSGFRLMIGWNAGGDEDIDFVDVYDNQASVTACAAAITANGAGLVSVVSFTTGGSVVLQQGVGGEFSGGDSGVDDIDADRMTALLAGFSADLGPGMFVMDSLLYDTFGDVEGGVFEALGRHLAANDRFAYLHSDPSNGVSALMNQGDVQALVPGLVDPGDVFTMVAPWVAIPAAAPLVAGPVAACPPAWWLAGCQARTDAAVGHANQPAMGVFGDARYAIGLIGLDGAPADGDVFSEADIASADQGPGDNGIIMIRSSKAHPCRAMGARTLSLSELSYFLGNVRMTQLLRYRCHAIADNYVGRMIDGRGLVFHDLAGELTSMLTSYYDLNALFGKTAQDAFGVDIGDTVNTPSTIAAGEIHAAAWFVASPTGQRVVIDLVRQGVPSA